ncbi:MAG: 2-oxoacid:ferredoxin oxidoreductase subunit beta [Planctomycetes bacterium]|nr:2-oxoacid:ferredoxin oxidoreductase subunit beta [Planctomycetota bacterium]
MISPPLTKNDFKTDQEVRWCPGCGDYAILNAVQTVFPMLGIPKEKFVVVSGIGCSSRLPYYVNTYGFHSIHGRAPAIATGIKIANPELSVWIGTGDGDSLSIGGNHLIHAMRRNLDVKLLMFNNRIYGLTKGQFSPTSEVGKVTKSTPYGVVDQPFNPIALALGAGATFVARSVDIMSKHLIEVLQRAANHKGFAFVEIYQNCNIFNDGAFDHLVDAGIRDEHLIALEHGKPLKFGKAKDKGIKLNGFKPEVVPLASTPDSELLVWDEHDPSSALPFFVSAMPEGTMPQGIGVFRDVDRPTFDGEMAAQHANVMKKYGAGSLEKLLYEGDTWKVG